MALLRARAWLGAPLLGVLGLAAAWLHHRTTVYDHHITQAAARNKLDFSLVKALIYEESWFRPDIRGNSGEVGLMQVSLAAARDFSVRKGFPEISEARLLEPDLNLEVGCWYLRQSLDRYLDSPCPLVFGLARYNAGEIKADEWGKRAKEKIHDTSAEEYCLSLIDYPKTRDYARRILMRYRSRNFFF